MNQVFIFLFIFLSTLPLNNGRVLSEKITDGPYIFKSGKIFNAIWMKDGRINKIKLTRRNFVELKKDFNLGFRFNDLVATYFVKPDYHQTFRNVDSIAAISDIHGAFSGYIRLLKSQGIIDENLNWNFGSGHLVILGDIFDRGDKVTEILWHLFALEKQAAKAGGDVHIILGNHELMTFTGDLRYTNPKYLKVADSIGIDYPELFTTDAVLGRWLRYKPVILSLNNILFVHAGFSDELFERQISIEEINRLFFQMLVEKAVESQNDMRNLVLLTEENGPLWYRGFFDEQAFPEARVDSILGYYKKEKIIVGHVTIDRIRSMYHNKVIGIDAGLGSDLPGAMLIIKGSSFWIGTGDGRRVRM